MRHFRGRENDNWRSGRPPNSPPTCCNILLYSPFSLSTYKSTYKQLCSALERVEDQFLEWQPY